jgi:hypothetical protein
LATVAPAQMEFKPQKSAFEPVAVSCTLSGAAPIPGNVTGVTEQFTY